MATFPVNDKVVELEERIIKPSNRNVSSAGYAMTFSRGTIKKKAFIMRLSWLSKSEKDTIETFFNDNQGLEFTLNSPDPNDSGSYNVIFDQDDLSFKYIRAFPGVYSLDLNVREV